MNDKYILSIVGPTAVGKSALAIAIAKKVDAVIVSVDACQIYRGMDIGTAKLSLQAQNGVPHFMLDVISPDMGYSAGAFIDDLKPILEGVFQNNDLVILCGGSGLYFHAIWHGLNEIPAIPAKIRKEVRQSYAAQGLAPFLKELAQTDPEAYEKIDLQNPHRVLRAVEVYRAFQVSISTYWKQKNHSPFPYKNLKIGIEEERELLYRRINKRVDQMMAAGLEAEAKQLFEQFGTAAPGLQAVGYREWSLYFKGEQTLEETLRLIKRNSRRLAKRQFTWFKREKDIFWIKTGQTVKALEWLEANLK